MKVAKKFFLLLTILFFNLWTWEIFKENIVLAISLLSITITLFALEILKTTFFHKIIFLILVFSYLAVSILQISKLDKSILEKNPTEVSIFHRQHAYFAEGLGFLYTNKFSLQFYTHLYYPLAKYFRNVSYCIDPNLYFFHSHPREKSGIDEVAKYSPLVLPFFIIGLFIHFLSLERYKLLNIYLILSVLLTGFISPYFKLGPVLIFPYINIIILLGIMKTLEFFSHKYAY